MKSEKRDREREREKERKNEKQIQTKYLYVMIEATWLECISHSMLHFDHRFVTI